MRFRCVLVHDLIGLVGGRVVVCASNGDGHPTLAITGVLFGALDVAGAVGGPRPRRVKMPPLSADGILRGR